MVDIASYLKHISILIADPDEKIRRLVKDVLAQAGFTNVMLTDCGEKAIEYIRENDTDLLITDWRMSPINGIQLTEYLRKHASSPTPYLPIIMLTGKAEHNDVSTARDTGVTEFLVKPFTAKALYQRLVMVIENPRSFIIAQDYAGPNRRRRTDIPPNGEDRRITPPVNDEF